MHLLTYVPPKHNPWNKGKITGQKPPLKLQEIWAIRFRLQLDRRIRDLAIFNEGDSPRTTETSFPSRRRFSMLTPSLGLILERSTSVRCRTCSGCSNSPPPPNSGGSMNRLTDKFPKTPLKQCYLESPTGDPFVPRYHMGNVIRQ